MSVAKIENDVQIHAWGQWARPRIDRMLGAKTPGWVELVKPAEGWADAETPREPPPRAPEEYCVTVDRMIAAMGPEVLRVMVALYCYGVSVNALARRTRLSKHQVMQVRDCALNQIYGALFLNNLSDTG